MCDVAPLWHLMRRVAPNSGLNLDDLIGDQANGDAEEEYDSKNNPKSSAKCTSQAVGPDGRWAAQPLPSNERLRGLRVCPRHEIVDAVHR